MKIFNRIAELIYLRKKEMNILVVGLENSEKSVAIKFFKILEEQNAQILSTVMYNVSKFLCK